jgi:hypothetical protein
MAALHQKEGLYQEEKITARISGRSHLIKENEAKNYNSLWGGGGVGGQQDGYPSRPPLPQLADQQVKTAGLPSPPMWGPPKMTCQGPARDPPRPTTCQVTRGAGRGGKVPLFQILIN